MSVSLLFVAYKLRRMGSSFVFHNKSPMLRRTFWEEVDSHVNKSTLLPRHTMLLQLLPIKQNYFLTITYLSYHAFVITSNKNKIVLWPSHIFLRKPEVLFDLHNSYLLGWPRRAYLIASSPLYSYIAMYAATKDQVSYGSLHSDMPFRGETPIQWCLCRAELGKQGYSVL